MDLSGLWARIQQLLGQLGNTIERLANQLGDVNTTINLIRGTQTTQDTTIGLINTTVTSIHNDGVPVDLTPALDAIQAVRLDTTEPHLATLTDIVNLLGDLSTQIGSPVQTTVAPGWYTAPTEVDLSGIPAAVLAATIPVEDWCQLDPDYPVSWILSNLYQFVQLQTRGNGYAWINDPHFTLHDCFPWTLIANLHGDDGREVYLPPTVDWATYDGSVDLATFLNSIDPRNTWHGYGVLGSTANGCQRELTNQPLDQSYVECHLQWTRTNQLVNTLTDDVALLPDQIAVAPVWPGLANVTLGTPVPLDSGVTIVTPMDGVVISITGTDPDFDHYYTYDDLRAYRNVGALVFLDDDGHAEGFQPIGFVSAVYCPRSMKQAAAVKLKVGHGLTGTVTPWTITGS